MARTIGRITSCATLAVLLVAYASPGSAQGTKMSDVANQLRTALAGESVTVTQEGPVTLTSSANSMFPSAGWELNAGAPVLAKIVPTLAKLQHTEIVVGGYTDNATVGPTAPERGSFNQSRPLVQAGRERGGLSRVERCKAQPVIGSMLRRHAPRCTERHGRGKGEELARGYHSHRGWHLVRTSPDFSKGYLPPGFSTSCVAGRPWWSAIDWLSRAGRVRLQRPRAAATADRVEARPPALDKAVD